MDTYKWHFHLKMQAAYEYIPRNINSILSLYYYITKGRKKMSRRKSSVIHITASSYYNPYGVKITHGCKFLEGVTRWHTGVKCCMLDGSSFHGVQNSWYEKDIQKPPCRQGWKLGNQTNVADSKLFSYNNNQHQMSCGGGEQAVLGD